MTTRFKISLAAALAAIAVATAAPMLIAASSAKATEARQDQPQQRHISSCCEQSRSTSSGAEVAS